MNTLTNVEIVRLALDMLGATVTVSSLETPQNSAERKAARVYEQAVRVEIAKRRWVFATRRATLEPDATPDDNHQIDGRIRYAIPSDCLRFWKSDEDDWLREGSYLYSRYAEKLDIVYAQRKPEAEWDPLFVDLLIVAIAQKLTEWATKSAGLHDRLRAAYEDARREAARANAFQIGPENINGAETSWQYERWV